VTPLPRVFDTTTGNVDRITDTVAGFGCEDVDLRLTTHDLQLRDSVGALEVTRDEQRGVALVLEPAAELAGERGLAGTLEPGQQDHRRWRLRQSEATRLPTEDAHELFVHDLDDLLRRVQGLADLRTLGALLDRRDEVLDDRQRDVGFEQGDPDLPRGRIDVVVGQAPLAAQRGEDRLEPVGERVEHGWISPRESWGRLDPD